MHWVVERAKNDVNTMQLNGIYLYSKYNPKQEAEKFISKEVNVQTKHYILFGLGLGYHAEALLNLTQDTAIYIVLVDKKELDFCWQYGSAQLLQSDRVHFVTGQMELKSLSAEHLQIVILKLGKCLIVPSVKLCTRILLKISPIIIRVSNYLKGLGKVV
ncbi:motility associated factor glycosyltransferase family protein [Viridibacillus sp. YIM B01967]|uniref:Motility associated factor glycosyltransferase family protein n=1 Tax=Viridibacillus soli TaxID=2798301 RepID=A0ABS1H5Y9_9BACL|nr:motility associated factor glycosyltransferase family protein [Viridibacillus soli]MBK3494833.1 motility associated factor glycosyltransferase family protein [Viridibacillus soli]